MANINIVLHEPEIPQNTGNIARTCAATGAALHIIKPMGFEIDDKKLKRAGLDYWHLLDITYYDDLEDFFSKNKDVMEFLSNIDVLIDGRESKGLPEDLLASNYEKCVRIPMRPNLRSLNLSNSVAIAVYEVFRQNEFEGLLEEGTPTTFMWKDYKI